MMLGLQRIVLTLWVGSMWAIGYIAAPVLFSVLDDRTLAGTLAGQMFSIVSYLGLGCGVLLLGSYWLGRAESSVRAWRVWAIIFMLLIISIGQFGLTPLMAELRAAGLSGETAQQFGRLHGIASILFLINSGLGLALVAGRQATKAS